MALHNLVSAMVQCLTGTDLVATHNWLCWRHWLLAPPLQSALTCPSSSSHSSLQYSRLSQLNVNSIPALLPALLLSDLLRRKGRRLAPTCDQVDFQYTEVADVGCQSHCVSTVNSQQSPHFETTPALYQAANSNQNFVNNILFLLNKISHNK